MVDKLHKRGARMLSGKLRQTERRLVTVTRGATSIELYAGVSHGLFEQVTEFAGNLRTEVWKFTVNRADLFDSVLGEPQSGDEWSFAIGGETRVYIVAKDNQIPAWTPLDEYGNDVRVNTKYLRSQ